MRYRLSGVFAASTAALLAALTLAGCGASEPAAKITAVEISRGSLRSGTTAEAAVSVKNAGAREETFWVGYSVRGPDGTCHEAPPVSVRLAAGEASESRKLSTPALMVPGYYDARISVWEERPMRDTGEAQHRLAGFQKEAALRIFEAEERFESTLDARWTVSSRKLGRGRLDAANVAVEGGRLRVTLPEGRLNGGQIESRGLYGPGFYAARIKVPNAPSSITGFFLYRAPDLASEIDIEIFNDSSGKVMFTTYADGEQTNTATMRLPFDPTRGFHDYAFLYGERSVTFFVDGKPVKTYEDGLPDRPMHLYVNAWYPTWLAGRQSVSDRHVEIEWIEH